MFCSVETALEDLRQGKFLVLVDAREREDEGDLLLAAEYVTGEKVNTMLSAARGMFHLATTEAHLEQLGIPLITPRHGGQVTPRFGLPFDARRGIGTGISAADRALTIRQAIFPQSGPDDFVIPGHVLPLAARRGGLRERQGHTEGSVELARLAGLFPAVAMSEVLTSAGDAARGEELRKAAARLDCKLIDMAQVCRAAAAAPPPQSGSA
jgi:3,4-dihydroxy 2-butanone 4-phosphate synthase/GTP cyclohydrolase II